MIFSQFPDLTWLKQQSEKRFVDRKGWNGIALTQQGWPTVILNVYTKNTYRDNIRGPLSLFTNLQGESHVETGSKRFLIKEGFFYLSNHDQHYTLDIKDSKPAETFNIHFGEYFADQVFQSLQHPDTLLEKNFEMPHERMEFHNTLRPKTSSMQHIIREIKQTPQPSSLWLEEKLYALISELITNENILKERKHYLPALKLSAREEIFERLLRSVDYIYSGFHQNISLDTLATVACLSKFHFLRLFKLTFHKTPHQFITEVRIQRGIELLKSKSMDVKAIARAVGFDDASSFSRSFRQQTGVYPTQFVSQR